VIAGNDRACPTELKDGWAADDFWLADTMEKNLEPR
jgi:hypothetical protein